MAKSTKATKKTVKLCDFPDLPARGRKFPLTFDNVKALLNHYGVVPYTVYKLLEEIDTTYTTKHYSEDFPAGYWFGARFAFAQGFQGLRGSDCINQSLQKSILMIKGMAEQQGLNTGGLEKMVLLIANDNPVNSHQDMMQKVFKPQAELCYKVGIYA